MSQKGELDAIFKMDHLPSSRFGWLDRTGCCAGILFIQHRKRAHVRAHQLDADRADLHLTEHEFDPFVLRLPQQKKRAFLVASLVEQDERVIGTAARSFRRRIHFSGGVHSSKRLDHGWPLDFIRDPLFLPVSL